jgi:steroid delta-isomerase-like uncharacterized protein
VEANRTKADKSLVHAYIDALNRGDLAALARCLHDDFRTHGAAGDATANGLIQSVPELRSSFPDLTVTLDELVLDEGRANVRCTLRGTSRGRFHGFPPTKKGFEVVSVEWLRLEDGKIREAWGGTDAFAILQQTGALLAAQTRPRVLLGRVLLALVALVTFPLPLLILAGSPGDLGGATRALLAATGGAFVRVAGGLAAALLAWAVVRPRDGARFAVAIPGLTLIAALVLATVGGPGAHEAATLGEAVNAVWANRVHVVAAAKVGLYAASVAACIAGLAFALRARAASGSPTATVRAALLPFVVFGVLFFTLRVWSQDAEASLLLLQCAIVTTTAFASATAIGGARGDADAVARDSLSAAACSLVGMVLGVASVGVQFVRGFNIDSAPGLAYAARFPAIRGEVLWPASRYLLPVAVAGLMGARWRASAAKAAAREVAGPLLAALVGTGAIAMVIGDAMSRLRAPLGSGLPPLDPRLADQRWCGELPLGAVVRAGSGRLMLPDGPAGSDLDAAFKRLDARAPDDDVWLSFDVDSTPFRETGELLAAAGRARGPRGLGSPVLRVPLHGCAVVLVGRAPDGTVSCSEPLALVVEGCRPVERYDGPVLQAQLRKDRTVTLSAGGRPKSGTLDDLAKLACSAWDEFGRHTSPYDHAFDRAELEISPAASWSDVASALVALRAVVRSVQFNYKNEIHAAFRISLAPLADDAR